MHVVFLVVASKALISLEELLKLKTSAIEQAMKNVSDGKYNRSELLNLKVNAEAYLMENPRIFDLLELISNT